jgi:type IV pilus assembly protein PilQ
MLSLEKIYNKAFSTIVLLGGVLLHVSIVQSSVLQDIKFAELPGDRFEVRLSFDDAPAQPNGYTIEKPARIILDFSGVENALQEKKYPLSFANARSAVVLSGGDRTRLVLNMTELDPYVTRLEGNTMVLEVGGNGVSVPSGNNSPVLNSTASEELAINSVDFRRGEAGEGKIIIGLTSPSVNVDVEQKGDKVVVSFADVLLPESLRRNLDVIDFATPVSLIKAESGSSKAVFEIQTIEEYDYLAYQADNEYVISIKPMTDEELEERQSRFAFVGEKLSLNFQNIEVRSVLQLIADFTELNLVASDTVTGSITLRLDNVPWDQALNLVLKTKGLDKRQIGNVLMVAPAAEIAERERQEIETKKQLQELAPLQTEYIRIKYANAKELFELFSVDEGDSDDGTSTTSILSERGSAIVDDRTNSIILTDTAEKISEFTQLIDKIDVPIRQVMIEARIVVATTDFRKELGVRIAGDYVTTTRGGKQEMSGTLDGLTNGDGDGPEGLFIDSDGDGISDDERNLVTSNLVDLGLQNAAGSLAWNILTDNFLLGIELSAMQDSGFGEIVAQPKVITGDKQKAYIQSGTEIPYQEASSSGATTTSFKEAVLQLEVTPQITPDNHVIMDLIINQDSLGDLDLATGIPIIDVTELQTQVLVDDGQTVVLGGIFQTERIEGVTKVPLLGDIPFIGRLFRQEVRNEEKRELLIFVTPKILSDGLVK